VKRFVAALALFAGTSAAAQPVPPVEVKAALTEIADGIDTVLLDEAGKARGDYDWQSGRWSEYEVAWHTGQAIEGLLWAYHATGKAAYLNRAREAGDYWVGLEIKDGPFKGMINAAHGDRLGPLINFTTVGNGTPGLFHLSRVTGDPRYADVASRAIDWLASNTAVPGEAGLYYNILDPESGTIWRDRSPHHDVAKASLTQVARPNIEGSPFLDACEHLKRKKLCAAHDALAAATAKRQGKNGFWMEFEPNNPADGTVHPRFNSWNAEAMLRQYQRSKDLRYLEAALATARANAAMMRPDGSFDYAQNVNGSAGTISPTGSATAFAGILWLGLRGQGHTEFDAQIHTAARWLIANRYPANHPDANLRGLILERRIKGGKIVQRDLGNMFAARFLAQYLAAFP
jgi:uncharacterized protein YyaL (SSP411 family)